MSFDIILRGPTGFNVILSTPTGGDEGKPKAWTGSVWARKPVKVWTGSVWSEKPMKRWTGSAWVLV